MMKYLMLVNQNVQDLHKPRGRRQAGPPNGPTITVQQTLVTQQKVMWSWWIQHLQVDHWNHLIFLIPFRTSKIEELNTLSVLWSLGKVMPRLYIIIPVEKSSPPDRGEGTSYRFQQSLPT